MYKTAIAVDILRYRFINAHKKTWPVRLMSRVKYITTEKEKKKTFSYRK